MISVNTLCVLVLVTSAVGFDPSTFDYCLITCNTRSGKVKHTACSCSVKSPRVEISTDITKFRQEIVDAHNKLRNKIASGGETSTYPHIPSASDMLAMNYDLELEHIARCLAVNSYDGNHDKCRVTHEEKSVGQNLAMQSYEMKDFPEIVQRWYNEIDAIDGGRLDSFSVCPKVCGHFTQVIWSRADYIGCARLNYTGDRMPYVLICNYGSSLGSAGNFLSQPVYKKGAPCTSCPNGLKCEDSRYSALCGKSQDVPADEPEKLASGVSDKIRSPELFFFVLALILLF